MRRRRGKPLNEKVGEKEGKAGRRWFRGSEGEGRLEEEGVGRPMKTKTEKKIGSTQIDLLARKGRRRRR